MSELLWWGYRHVNGSLQAKRFFSEADLDEANDSPFVARIVPQFAAASREDALKIIGERC